MAVAIFLAVGVAFSGWVAFGGDGDTRYRAAPLPGLDESPSPTSAPDVPSPDDLPTPGPETDGPSSAPTDVPTDLPGLPSPSATPFGTPSSPALTGGDPPAGYSTQSDPAGFHLAVPDGWLRTVEGPSVFYTSPDDSTMIQIFELHGPEATPYESAREAERLASRHRGYEQVTLAPLGTAAMDPVQLEYTYDSTSDGHRRIMDRRFAAPSGTMYAVLVIGPSGDRASEQEIHRAALDTFCPTASCIAP
ncbi:serine/arginine repetitive matrix protein 2 [Streptomyces sp. 205]|uniref:Serine/arginine repetitive matrix protein 2 n=1 Tax=Streptomyces coffeae TaxID=621382 RepID=A0ABS1N5V7_9ACTN|nr:serine/arginine repetitive matrix protein 2 [Streptomyces coffeae]